MNKVFLIGNLTRDPESGTTASGVSYCRFTIAVNRPFTSADGTRETDFFNLIAWRKQAELCSKYLHKGNKVSIVGSIQNRTYEVNGEKRNTTDVILDEIEFLTPRAESGAGSFDTPAAPAPQETKVAELEPVEDTDLPF